MSNPSQPTPGDEAARVAHQFPKGFVDAAFAAREKGLRAICFTCYTGFNEPECPVCHPVAAPPGGGGRPPLLTDKEGEQAVDMFHRLQREENPYALTMVIEHFRQRAASPLPAVAATGAIELLRDVLAYLPVMHGDYMMTNGATPMQQVLLAKKIRDFLVSPAAAAPEAPGIPASAVLGYLQGRKWIMPDGTAWTWADEFGWKLNDDTLRGVLVRADRVSILPDPPQEG